MEDGTEAMQNEVIKDLEHHARHFCVDAENLKRELLVEIDLSKRRALAETLQMVIGHSKEILEGLNISCLFCRRTGGENLGKCVVCGRDVCGYCGQMADGEPVHIKVCAMWYKKSKGNEE